MTLLTIGIPTYNRAGRLKKLLNKLLPAAETEGIEVLVSDNCSTDYTPEMLKEYAAYSSLRCVRNPENVEFDGNILNLLDRASGRFLWLMGDDDDIDVEQLPGVHRLLQGHPKIPLFFINYRYDWTRDKDSLKNAKLTSFSIDPQQYADGFLYRSSLISTIIINMEYYKKLSINPACVNKGWIHLHILLLLADLLKKINARVIVVKNRLVIQGSDEEEYPMERWIKFFVENFCFVMENTPIGCLDRRKFIKGYYDIDIRPRFLNVKDFMSLKDPLDLYRKVVKMFSPNLTGRMAFWLLYLLLWKIPSLNKSR